MKPIANLRPGSTMAVFIFDDAIKNVVLYEASLVENDVFEIADQNGIRKLKWGDLFATPREAIEGHINKLQCERSKLYMEILDCETLLKIEYPIHPVLSKEEFKAKYPNLPGHERTEDFDPHTLSERQARAYWREHQYDAPG